MLDFTERILNARPDPIDPRDRKFRSLMMAARRPQIPDEIDPRAAHVGPVFDQGMTGSCVGNAMSKLAFWYVFAKTGVDVPFSVRWIWQGAKEIDSWCPSVCFEFAGTGSRDALKFMRKYGACEDWLWPFDQQEPDPNLEEEIIANALQYRIGSYHRLDTDQESRIHLATVGPHVAGVPVFENWDQIGSDGIVPMPDGQELGGHEILITGYTRIGRGFINSWSEDWGYGGYGVLPYNYPVWDQYGLTL